MLIIHEDYAQVVLVDFELYRNYEQYLQVHLFDYNLKEIISLSHRYVECFQRQFRVRRFVFC